MPQLTVFMSESDLELIVSELLSAECKFVPDDLQEHPVVIQIDSLASFREWRAKRHTTLFFVVSADWTVSPFEWGSIEKCGVERFFIRQKTGGPTLDILAPFLISSPNEMAILPHGFVAYHSYYRNTTTNQCARPAAPLVTMYKRLVRMLKNGADQLRGKNRRYTVARGAKELLRTGCMLGPPFRSPPGPAISLGTTGSID